MAPKDAEMPSYETLRDDVQKIAKHLASLRGDLDKVTASSSGPACIRRSMRVTRLPRC